MGEAADFIMESAWIDHDGPEQPMRCKYCKREGFYWDHRDDSSWRLVTKTGIVHKCKAYTHRENQSDEK